MTRFQVWQRRLRYGLPTVLGLQTKGYFIPHRYAGDALPPGERSGYEALETRLAACRNEFAGCLADLTVFQDELLAIGAAPAPAPRWSQDWFPRLDAAMAYRMTRRIAPARIIEIGSGHSTRFYAQSVADGGLETEIRAIDPQPRSTLEGLDRVTLDRRTLQDAGLDPFGELAPGDILSIDSSHILMPGTDVDLLLNHVMPNLPVGGIVHIHDIFLPDGYPADWAWRGYNEQLGVAALLNNAQWRPLFASHYAVTRMQDAVANSIICRLPLVAGALESSLWLEKGDTIGSKKR